LHPHELKHTAIALWIASGAGPLEVSRRAGHTSVSFTFDRYGHLFPEADQSVADRLDALIADGQKTDNVSAKESVKRPGKPATREESSGRWGTRTLDLSRVKAAL